MEDATKRLLELVKTRHPGSIVDENGGRLEVAEVAVTVDGM